MEKTSKPAAALLKQSSRISQSGAQWRLLPVEYGNSNSIYKWFMRWCQMGVWERMLVAFAEDPDMENGMIDSRIVRAHPFAAGAPTVLRPRIQFVAYK